MKKRDWLFVIQRWGGTTFMLNLIFFVLDSQLFLLFLPFQKKNGHEYV